LFIETPYRNAALLEALAGSCQSATLISVATDITLATESIRTQTAAGWKRVIGSGRLPDFHKKPTVFSLLAA
jgi:16S rRNA (cytidine1402-2'-O)-methyltransferase